MADFTKSPEGIVASTVLAGCSVAVSAWLAPGKDPLVRSLVALVGPVTLYLAATFLVHLVRQMWAVPSRRPVLELSGSAVAEEGNWRVRIHQARDGAIEFGAGMLDYEEGWPLDAQWELTDPRGSKGVRLVRPIIPPVAQHIVWQSIARWPSDFAATPRHGRYELTWVVEGSVAMRRHFSIRMTRADRAVQPSASADQERPVQD